jgi:hypothetical protein
MKIAMIAGGQPRFTSEFLELLNQLQGFDSADLYLTFWKTDWVNTVEEGISKIQSILPSKYKLAGLQIVEQPIRNLPSHVKHHLPAEPENVRWAYNRRTGMWISTKMSFDMIETEYDAYIKFRPDGMLSESVDIRSLDLVNKELIYPDWPRNGKPGEEICDQFVIGTKEGMKFYCDMINHFDRYIPVVAPNWEDDIHTWASEHLLAQHLKEHNKPQTLGGFGHILAGIPGAITQGRSRFTDKHYHHPIIPGPI